MAAIAGLLGLLVWGEAWLIVVAAAIGAMAGTLPLLGEPREKRFLNVEVDTDEPEASTTIRSVLDALPFGVLIVGADETISHANRPIEEMFALQALAGQPVETLRSRRLLDQIGLAFSKGAPGTVEFVLSRAGDVYLRAHICPTGPPGQRELVVAIMDETRERRAQEVHRDFVANASHELKTPLAAVSGIIETLLGAARHDTEATERFLGLLSEQTVRMTRLIEDLLSLNRIELNARVMPDAPQDVMGVVTEVIDVLGAIAEAAGVSLVFEPLEEMPIVLADRDELSQLFSNLIDNAIKYGGEGGTVTVSARSPDADDEGMIGIAVEDTGPGIAREDLPRLTERFYRVNVKNSRESGGTGLGLAICKHIVTRHRGRLEIESRVGKGSRFTVWLPVMPDGTARASETASNRVPAQ